MVGIVTPTYLRGIVLEYRAPARQCFLSEMQALGERREA